MRGNPILNSLRTAEAAGYPALLVVAAVCLGLVVGPITLLGLTHAVWVLVLALLYLIVAIVVLSVAVGAALSEGDEPDAEGQEPRGHASDKRSPSQQPTPDRRPGRRARRRSAPEGPERVPAADGPPADELAVAGAEPGRTPRGRRPCAGVPAVEALTETEPVARDGFGPAGTGTARWSASQRLTAGRARHPERATLARGSVRSPTIPT